MMGTVLVEKSGSLWTGTLLHLGHNTVLMGIFFDLTRKTDAAKILLSESGLITGLVYAVFAIVFWKINSNPVGETEPGTNPDQSV